MKKLLLLVLITCITTQFIFAQSWRYGKRGGGTELTYSVGYVPAEDVWDMATDNNGNVYVLASVTTTGMNVDSHSLTGYGNHDVALYSFRCDGTFRWVKLFGAAAQDIPYALSVDKNGGVYVAFSMNIDYAPSSTAHIDADTTISRTDQSLYLVKYDTSGHYKWLLMPQADTVGGPSVSTTRTIDLNTDSAGNVYWLCRLPPGPIAKGLYNVPSYGIYLLKYNSAGIFQSADQVKMTTDYPLGAGVFNIFMKINPRANKFYLSGAYQGDGTLVLGTDTVKHSMYLGCFDIAGNFLWEKQDTAAPNPNGFFGRPVIDPRGNLYLGGTIFPPDYFYGFNMNNIYYDGTQSESPFILKTDSNGNVLWAHQALTNASSEGEGIALRNDGEVDLVGEYPGLLKWTDAGNTDSFNTAPNVGYHAFIARFNTQTGKLIGMDSLATDFGNAVYFMNDGNERSSIVSDGRDNIYIGGQFTNELFVNGATLANVGGETDFFVAKYGFDNCGCTSFPSAAFTSSFAKLVGSFTYTGSTADSLRWDFGDGATATGTNPGHTYADSGTYTICVTSYTSCGDDVNCQDIHVTGTDDVANIYGSSIKLYPNPTTGLLNIENAAGAAVRVYNIMGQQIYSGAITNNKYEIDLGGFTSGTYLLQITDNRGTRYTKTIIKQ
jgi:PKD repeat protein